MHRFWRKVTVKKVSETIWLCPSTLLNWLLSHGFASCVPWQITARNMTEHSREICYPLPKRTGMAGGAWFWLDTPFWANLSSKYASSLKRIDLWSFWKKGDGGEGHSWCCKCTALLYKSEVFSVCLCAYQFQNSCLTLNKTQNRKFHKSFGRTSWTVIH